LHHCAPSHQSPSHALCDLEKFVQRKEDNATQI
jgi:hypothetical protein